MSDSSNTQFWLKIKQFLFLKNKEIECFEIKAEVSLNFSFPKNEWIMNWLKAKNFIDFNLAKLGSFATS